MTRKVKLSFLIVVWSIVAIQIYINYQEKMKNQSDAITAFSVMEDESMEEVVSGYGYFGTMEIEENTKQEMLKNLAYKLGITDGYEFSTGSGADFEKMVLTKEGKHATTTIQIISMQGKETEPEQYIAMEIKAKEKTENAVSLYNKMKRVYKEIGVEAQVSLEMEVEQNGNCIADEEGSLTEEILEVTEPKKVDSIMDDNVFTVYGYTKLEPSYMKLNLRKVNIQIVMSYDEEQDKTYVKVGIPIVNSSY